MDWSCSTITPSPQDSFYDEGMPPYKMRTALTCLWIELIFMALVLLVMGIFLWLFQLPTIRSGFDPNPQGILLLQGVLVFCMLLQGAFIAWHLVVIRGLKQGGQGAWLHACIVFGLGILLGVVITGVIGLVTLLDPEVKAFYQSKG